MIAVSLENLFYFYLKVPVVLGFVLYFLHSSSYKYNCLIQDYGRVLHTIGFIFTTKGFFWTWVVHPFLNSMNKWIFSIFTFHCVWIHTFPALCMKLYFHYSYHFCGCVVCPVKNWVCLVLSIRVNFLLHHRNRANWIWKFKYVYKHPWTFRPPIYKLINSSFMSNN